MMNNKNIGWTIFFGIEAIVFAIIFIMLPVMEMEKFYHLQVVDAQIVKHERYEDPLNEYIENEIKQSPDIPKQVVTKDVLKSFLQEEEESQYQAYIGYEINGKSYEQEYGPVREKDDLIPIGTHYQLRIDPNEPTKWKHEAEIMSTPFVVYIGSVFVALSIALVRRKWLTGKQSHGLESSPTKQIVQKDIKLEIKSRETLTMLPLICAGMMALYIRYPICRKTVIIPVVLICAVVWVALFRKALRQWRQIKNEEFDVHESVLESISQGDKRGTYLLHYRCGGDAWDRTVNRFEYASAEVGEIVQTVYLHGQYTPIMHYDKKGNVCF